MTGTLTLIISTPLDVIFHADDIRSFRAADASGDFGIMPGHVPFLSVLDACVARWRSDADWTFCALRGGILTVEHGNEIRIACRKAILGRDLPQLQSDVRRKLEAEAEAARAARVQQTRLHARAIRQIMMHIAGGGGFDPEATLDGLP